MPDQLKQSLWSGPQLWWIQGPLGRVFCAAMAENPSARVVAPTVSVLEPSPSEGSRDLVSSYTGLNA